MIVAIEPASDAGSIRRQGRVEMQHQTIVSRREALLEAGIDDELVGLHVEKGTCYGFNRTATRIWSLIETPRSVSELVDALTAEYDVDRETCTQQLAEMLAELERDGLVELNAPPAA